MLERKLSIFTFEEMQWHHERNARKTDVTFRSSSYPLASLCILDQIDAAAIAVAETDVVVMVMIPHEMSFDVSELAIADATTAVLRGSF